MGHLRLIEAGLDEGREFGAITSAAIFSTGINRSDAKLMQ